MNLDMILLSREKCERVSVVRVFYCRWEEWLGAVKGKDENL